MYLWLLGEHDEPVGLLSSSWGGFITKYFVLCPSLVFGLVSVPYQ